jgi:hypothetical protein
METKQSADWASESIVPAMVEAILSGRHREVVTLLRHLAQWRSGVGSTSRFPVTRNLVCEPKLADPKKKTQRGPEKCC